MKLALDQPRPVRLRSIQKLFGSAIFRPLTPDYQMQETWSDGRPTAEVADTLVKPNDRLTSFERLAIYNRQYWFRIIDSFHDDYPGLRAILGQKRFQHLTREYLAAHPSKSFTLRNLGQFLVDFLKKNPRLTTPNTAAAVDMARLEWAHIEAFDNAALPPLKLADLQAAAPDRLRLALQPHITLLSLTYAVDDYLIAVKAALAKSKGKIPVIRRRPQKKSCFLAAHRHNNSVYYKPLSPAEFHLLSALHLGTPLAPAIEAALQKVPAKHLPSADQIRAWFENWTALGWFCRT